MLFSRKSPAQKRVDFRAALKSGKLLRFPGAFSPLVSMLVERHGFEGVYISGAVLANDLGLPDVGLTTLTEVSQRGRAIARATELPAIIDADTGFGEPMNAARTVQELEELGLCGCHFEDQQNPKRCGHLDGKALVSTDEMVKKIRAAVTARRDSNFVIIARTDARASEGLDGAINRAKAYVGAGADMIFAEALADESEFAKFRKAVAAPLLANMTEFGKSKLLTTRQLAEAGVNVVIYPVTLLRLAMKAVEDGLGVLKQAGTQEPLLKEMQTRAELYELLRYKDYEQFDKDVFNFRL
ncbi:MAG TPA: methylisocitrate lyase [Candidatus Polarisedimenticolia bacterium]|nr:methylisocitrate lyase [Candidatus Polarisedimenticolia bacterium]